MSSLIRWEPFREMAALRDRMERLFGGETGGRAWATDEGLAAGVWAPPVDVYETGDSIILKADLPEVDQKDVDISVQGNTLTIRGERKKDEKIEEQDYYRVERQYGMFTRSFALPASVDPEKIDASFGHGVLQITLPKREESKPKQIKVKVSGDGK